MHFDLKDPHSAASVITDIDIFLRSRGFENLGKNTKMLEILESTHNEFVSEVMQRETHFKNRKENIDVRVVDYSNPDIKKRHTVYPSANARPSSAPSVEIDIYDNRPGGFGPSAHLLHGELKSYLNAKDVGTLITIFEPPATNDAEYYRVRVVNLVASVVWWVVVFVLALLVSGSISRALLNRSRLGIRGKMAAFALINSLLVTPLPFPAGFIFVIVLPSAFALPAIGSDYFSRVQSYAIPSFCISILLCSAVSVLLFRSRATN